tara:strand:+ start:69 stop:581 length:513 start_codon:yes stop_codon:yes gene_type:complete
MAYKQRSNGLPFKQMGSTPSKQKDYSTKEWEGEGPTRDFDDREISGSPNAPLEGFTKRKHKAQVDDFNMKHGKYKLDKVSIKNPKTVAKQIKVDENRYPKPNFEIHSEEVDLTKKSGFGPSTAFGGSKNRELVKDKKVKSKKVFKDGNNNRAIYKGKVVKGNWQPHQIKK